MHKLSKDDFDQRTQLCEQIIIMSDEFLDFIENIIFKRLIYFVNSQNFRYWTMENPHWMQEVHTQYPQKTFGQALLLHRNANWKILLTIIFNLLSFLIKLFFFLFLNF